MNVVKVARICRISLPSQKRYPRMTKGLSWQEEGAIMAGRRHVPCMMKKLSSSEEATSSDTHWRTFLYRI